MTPINLLDSAYLFDKGVVSLQYLSKDPYPYQGEDDILVAKAHLRAVSMKRHTCHIDWFRVPSEWIFQCPKHTFGFSYLWEQGELSVDLSPKNTDVCGFPSPQLRCIHPLFASRTLSLFTFKNGSGSSTLPGY